MRSMTPLLISAALAALSLSSTAAAQSGADKAFLTKAIKGDNSEIMLGKLAEQRGASSQTKDFGKMLQTDHAQARDEAARLASPAGVSPSTEPMAEASRESQKLQHMSGSAFDREFAKYMVKDHKKDISDFRKEAKRGHGAVADLAQRTVPTLEKHLQAAQALARSR